MFSLWSSRSCVWAGQRYWQDATVSISWVCVWRCGWCLQTTVFHQIGLVSWVLSIFLCLKHAVFWLINPQATTGFLYQIQYKLVTKIMQKQMSEKQAFICWNNKLCSICEIYIAYMISKGRRQRINTNRDCSLGPRVRTEVTHTKVNAQIVNNSYANPSSAKVPSFKRSLYIIHSMWSQIVPVFFFFLHSSLSCSVQPSNWSASCTLNEILLNYFILIWGKCKLEGESSTHFSVPWKVR